MEAGLDQSSEAQEIVGEADVTEADLAHVVTQLPGEQRSWLLPALLAVAIVVYLLVSPFPPGPETLPIVLPMAFVLVLVGFFRRGARRAWIKQAFANIGGPTKFRFDDFGFTSESSLRQHRLAWVVLARVTETPAAFLVYTTPRTVLVVPKRAFADADLPGLRQLHAARVIPQAVKGGAPGAQGRKVLLLWVVVLVSFLSIWHFLREESPPGRRHLRRETAAEALAPSSGAQPNASDPEE